MTGMQMMILKDAAKHPTLKLTKFLYGGQYDATKTPFGLLNHQTRITDGIIACAGWFNGSGEKLGAGDLSLKDMDNISKRIPAGERFIVLAEGDTLWNIPSSSDSSAPGVDYVMQRCIWHISSGKIIRVREAEKEEDIEREGVLYKRMKRQTFYADVGYGASKPIEPEPVVKKKITAEEATKIIAKKLGGFKPKSTIGSMLGVPVAKSATPAPAAKPTTTAPVATPVIKPKPAVYPPNPLAWPKPKIKKKVVPSP